MVTGRPGLTKSGLLCIPEVVDSDHTDPVKVWMQNTLDTPFIIGKGQRIVQVYLQPATTIHWNYVPRLNEPALVRHPNFGSI